MSKAGPTLLAHAVWNMCKALRQHPRQEGSKALVHFPVTTCGPSVSKATSSTLPFLRPHVRQVLGPKPDSAMLHLGRAHKIQRLLCSPHSKCNVATTALEPHKGPVFLSSMAVGKSLKLSVRFLLCNGALAVLILKGWAEDHMT